MKVLRSLAILSFVAGIAMLAAGILFSSRGQTHIAIDPEIPTSIAATPTPIPSPTPTLPPNAPTPTPTPAPFDGNVARLKIPRFKVDSAIESIGLLANNQLDTPKNPRNTGWYKIYDKPGFGGNAVFSAHVDYFPDIVGPFKNLAKAELGDEIDVQMMNGPEYKYRVIRRDRYDKDSIPMGDIIWPKDKPADREWVTLITCGGTFVKLRDDGLGEYLHRDVVVAERFE